MTLNIVQEEGGADYYIITYNGNSEDITTKVVNVTASQNTTKTYASLTPNMNFEFTVVPHKNGKQGAPNSVTFTTKEDSMY